MKKALIIGAVLLMVSSAGTAQSLDANPGITPDSPFYFMDRAFDRFRSSEAVADEKAAEVVAMAKKRNEVALSKAENSYSRAMERRMRNMGSESSEEVFNQTAKHMEAFSSAANATDSETITGLKRAMNSSARKMERAFDEFNRTDPDRANRVAERTLQRVMEKAPEQAQKGLQTAFKSVQRKMPAAGRAMKNMTGRPEDTGLEESPENGQGQNDRGNGESPGGEMSDSPDQPMSSNASDEVETENSSVDEPEGENPVNGSGQVSNGSMGDS